ncbi:MAG: glycosyltransferase family 2 protein [Clostridia bacterium]|nr:glycosyltransferase family 2 protein [Clostridia bacterium]
MLDISVIIPVYKTEKYLEKCVLSVLDGGMENIEILLIDDGSPDGSGALCDALCEKYEKVKVFHKKNGGLSSARNLGIDKAKGRYLCFVDSDDFLEIDSLFNMFSKAEKEAAEISIFGIIIDVEGSNSYKVSDGTYIITEENKDSHFESLKDKCLLDSCCNKLYLADFIKESRVFMPVGEIFEDTYFNLMLWQKMSKCAVFDDCYYHYLQRNSESLTKCFNPKKLKFLKERVKLMLLVTNGLESFCCYYYVKYVLSFLCDTFIKGSVMKAADRKQLILGEIKSPEFKEAAKKAIAKSIRGRLIIGVAKSNSFLLISLFLRLSCFIKYRLSKLYFKVK